MEKITITVEWCNKNFAAGVGREEFGAILVTANTYLQLKQEMTDAIKEHINSMVEDGETVPEWMITEDYELDFQPSAAALLHSLGNDTSLAAISSETGINQAQLSHYATGSKVPRPAQRQRIIDGIHAIGRRLISV